jgi:DNA-binding transcriptional regulator YiaG
MGGERKKDARKRAEWDDGSVRALRRHLGVSQEGLADELGTRQQTVSEWETGRYRPRGASARLLTIVAERAGFEYGSAKEMGEGQREMGKGQRATGTDE